MTLLKVFISSTLDKEAHLIVDKFKHVLEFVGKEDAEVIITDKEAFNVNIPVIVITDYAKLEKELFIERQVKFCYGNYYNILTKDNKLDIPINLHTVYHDSISDKFITNTEKTSVHCSNRVKEFMELVIKPVCNTDILSRKKFNVRMNDGIRVNNDYFLITFNRLPCDSNNILFPLQQMIDFKQTDSKSFKHKNNKCIWRGTNNGYPNIWFNTVKCPTYKKEKSCRTIFLENAFNIHPDIDVGYTKLLTDYWDSDALIKFTKPFMSIKDQKDSKFIINLEGNDYSTSFIWALASNCCPLHTFPFTFETVIFGNGLKEWVHFVPIAIDGSDIIEKYNWCLKHLDECETIANNGKEYMRLYLNPEYYNAIIKRMIDLYPVSG